MLTCKAGGNLGTCSLAGWPNEPFALTCLGLPAGLVVFAVVDAAFAAWGTIPMSVTTEMVMSGMLSYLSPCMEKRA